MSVDYLVCSNCGETFPDCGYWVSCESCGTDWCSDECAAEDGFIREHCSKHPDLDNRDLMETYRKLIVTLKTVPSANITIQKVVSIVEKKIMKTMFY